MAALRCPNNLPSSMGAGASQGGNVMGVLQAELQKPLDASDVQDLGYASNEIIRLRKGVSSSSPPSPALPHPNSQGPAPPADQSTRRSSVGGVNRSIATLLCLTLCLAATGAKQHDCANLGEYCGDWGCKKVPDCDCADFCGGVCDCKGVVTCGGVECGTQQECSGDGSCEWVQSVPWLLGIGLVVVCCGCYTMWFRNLSVDHSLRDSCPDPRLLLCLAVVGTLILGLVLCFTEDTRVLGIGLVVVCIGCYCWNLTFHAPRDHVLEPGEEPWGRRDGD